MGNDSIANAVGQGPVVTIESAGREYRLAPLRMKDMGLVEQFCKDQHRRDVMETIREAGDMLTSQERIEMISQLSRELSGGLQEEEEEAQPSGWTWMDEVSSPSVIEYVIVLRLRKAHPELTEEEAADLITVEAINAVKEGWSTLLGLDAFRAEGEEQPGEAASG